MQGANQAGLDVRHMSSPAMSGKRKGAPTSAPDRSAKRLHATRHSVLDANQKAVKRLLQKEALSKYVSKSPLLACHAHRSACDSDVFLGLTTPLPLGTGKTGRHLLTPGRLGNIAHMMLRYQLPRISLPSPPPPPRPAAIL